MHSNDDKMRKIWKAFALAGNHPSTPEQIGAYKKAMDMLNELRAEEVTPLPLLGGKFKKQFSFKDLFSKIKTIGKFDLSHFLMNTEYVRMQIVPDSSVRNHRTEDILRTIADQFSLPIDRLEFDGIKLTGIRIQERATYEIEFTSSGVRFYMTVPKHIEPIVKRRIMSVWDRASVEVAPARNPFDLEKTTIYELVYRRHDMYSLHTAANDNRPLSSIIESGKIISESERASVFAYFDPIQQVSWQFQLNAAWEKLRGGKVPRKTGSLNIRDVFRIGAMSLATLLQEIVSGASEIFSNGKSENIYANKPIDPEAAQFTIDQLTHSTREKRGKSGIKTYLWTVAESENPIRADLIARTIATSFYDLADDNELEAKKIKKKEKKAEVLKTMQNNTPPKLNLRYNIMSTAEASKIVQLPGSELQEKYPEIDNIQQMEIEIANDDFLNPDGLPVGEVKFKDETHEVFQPTKDEDEIVLPHVGIGGMGQGKTKGLLSNYALNTVLKGYGSISIDPNKREVGDQLQAAVDAKVLPADKFVRFDLGKEIFALDFCEAMYDDRSRSRLANMIIYFFNIADDTSGQTERFLRACVMGMETGRIEEIMRIFEKEDKLDAAIKRLQEIGDEYNLQTLQEYKSYQVGMRRKITSPIYNRINEILGDSHLAKCMKSEKSINFVEIMSQRKAFVFDVPADSLDKIAIDLVVNLLSLKIDIAMRMRKAIKGEEFEFPFFVLIDEPHQFSKSTGIWEEAVVESRKWKVCYFWTFHYWEQLPKKLQVAIRNALPHYHLYPTSPMTFKQLENEIYPFTVKEALKLKRWHAINIIKSGGERAIPFIAKMTPPPMDRYKNKK